MNYLFIGGCPRTGTTAIAELLNFDNRILMGIEAIKTNGADSREVKPSDFLDEEAFDDKLDNSYQPVSQKQGLIKSSREKRGICKTEFIGNKEPGYVYKLPYLADTFPNCKIIIMLRDLYAVASSFNVRAAREKDHWPLENDFRQAVKRWNRSLEVTKEFIEAGHLNDLFIVNYENLFSGQMRHFEALYRFLELDMTDSVLSGFEYMTKDWAERTSKPLHLDDEMRGYLDENKDKAVEEWILKKIDSQLVNQYSSVKAV